jgi:hypothetical protein
MSSTQQHSDVREVVRDGITRTLAIVGLAGMALIHLLDLPGTISAHPYIGWLYIGLIVSATAVGGVLRRSSDTRAWKATGGLALSVIVAYTLSRTTGLPGSTDDIGNWGQSLGIASLFVEGLLVALCASVVVERGRRTHGFATQALHARAARQAVA